MIEKVEKVILEDGTILTRKDTYYVDKGDYQEGYGGTDWDNPEKRAEIGAKPFQEVKEFDHTYYEEDGYVDTEKDGVVIRTYKSKQKLTKEELKDKCKKGFYSRLRMELAPTDGYVLDWIELDEPIPKEIAILRSGIRSVYLGKIDEVENVKDYDELVEVIENV